MSRARGRAVEPPTAFRRNGPIVPWVSCRDPQGFSSLQGETRSKRQLVLACWCVVVRRRRRRVVSVESPDVTVVGFALTPLLDMVTAVALSIFGVTSHCLWLIALAVTADLHSTPRLDLLLASPQTRTPLHELIV